MRDVEKTIGDMIDKQSSCYISSIDKEMNKYLENTI